MVLCVSGIGVTCCLLGSEVTVESLMWVWNATTSYPACSGCPNLEHAFSQKRHVIIVVIHGHCAELIYPRCHCVLEHFSSLFLNKLIHSFMYACSYAYTYVHKFLPVGAWWLTGKHCFRKSGAWCSVDKENIIDPLVTWSVVFNVREGCLYRFRK